jgi:fumarate hydratase, class II
LGYRKERDVLGEVNVPSDAYYGSETERAIENFPISGMRIQSSFIRNFAIIKRSAAVANMKVGALDKKRGAAIVKACDELISGKLSDQFPVDVFQAGAGTSTNMNLNEVIANRAIEILKGRKGDYKIIHPNDHVNMSQSTNDTFHTNIHVTVYREIEGELIPALKKLEGSFERKSKEFSNTVKIGRTHLQEAVPMTLGQEFYAFAGMVSSAIDNISLSAKDLLEIPLGGTAIGTGINTPNGYAKIAIAELDRYTGIRFKECRNIFAEMRNTNSELLVANSIDYAATLLSRIANDLRLLVSGPRTGFFDITLPEVQPGSSIMPGKINPSMPEMLDMVCFQAMGSAAVVRRASGEGQLELNVFMPITAFNLIFSVHLLSRGILAFEEKCVRGIRANEERLKGEVSMDLSLATALAPRIGYAKAAVIARDAYKKGRSVRASALEMTDLSERELDAILNPSKMIKNRPK